MKNFSIFPCYSWGNWGSENVSQELSSKAWIKPMLLSVQFSHLVMSNSLQPHELQHTRLPCYHRLLELAQTYVHWVGDAIQPSHPLSSSVILFSSRPQSFPASGSFPMSQLCISGGQCIRASASASVLAVNIQDWFPLGWTSWISLPSKGLSRVFSNTTVKSINSSVLSFLYSPNLRSIHDYQEKP